MPQLMHKSRRKRAKQQWGSVKEQAGVKAQCGQRDAYFGKQ